MFDTINGLPVHPLVVHAVVVLLPLSVLGTVVIALYPPWRRRYGSLVVAAAAAATALCPVATSSGEALERHVGDPGDHAHLGDQLIWFAVPLLVLALALVLLDRRDARGTATSEVDRGARGSRAVGRRGSRLTTVVALLSVVAAVATGVQVYRVGESGARAVWAGTGSKGH